MKADGAPEKIYFDGENKACKLPIFSSQNIEYTRTDAFIEKAAMFFEDNIKEEDCKFGYSEWVELKSNYESLDSFIRAFKKYMKEE